ncbi:hypothetical protein SARC_04061 [Sphaeroforma arctica JP610]|uniref:Uncharacterized protein n=1 Tax=Sphaeroforma arctica JP610 TaxID=667725 RepID=A0A0L0G3L9_9EUKA|nr:hypothetical protein SARC_04061 [Sphaeroforma arctica JP610]KNC83702.1 hypothetical protein SARC_04061 [Sphaeroforma arctica JP610]|eukprot:XP_014157604.1 hypothetical protein SARC_04061 [Sphaeroforma arctica JP610]
MQSNATMMTSTSASPEKRSGRNKMGSIDRNNDQYNNYDQYYDGQYDQFGNPMNGGGYDQYGNPLNGGHDQFSLMGALCGQYPYSGTFDNSSLAAGGYAQPSILSDASGASMYPNSPNIPPPDENGKIVITDADIIVL